MLVAPGSRMLVLPDGGYAVLRPGRLWTLAALDSGSARTLLAAALRECESEIEIGAMTAAQAWALELAIAAGLSPAPDGAVCTRGELGPLVPYLPSGMYL
jgi:hypothetical protein